MYCPRCGREIPEGSRFCMHCGADLREFKVEISPKVNISPKIDVRIPAEKKEDMCAICGVRKANAICTKCHRKVCDYHFEEPDGWCTLCLLSFLEEWVNEDFRAMCRELMMGYKDAPLLRKGFIEMNRERIKELKKKLRF